METKVFSALYTQDKSGKTRSWEIKVVNNGDHSAIICTYGLEGGKTTVTKRDITEGKNVGKTNETTHFQQAVSEAQSKWNGKVEKEGYVEKGTMRTLEVEEALGDKVVQVFPMLAQDYTKYEKKIAFPCYVQPKLDGFRAVFHSNGFYSRVGKPFYNLRVVSSAVKNMLSVLNKDLILDGELYTGDLLFEELGVLRKGEGKITNDDKDKIDRIQYHIYDIVDSTRTFEERLEVLKDIEKVVSEHNYLGKLVVVQTYSAGNRTEIDKYHDTFLKYGYEGTMVRSRNGMYKEKYRSYDLQKYKSFVDSEFVIDGYTYEKGHDQSKPVVWICKTKEGKTFNVQSTGTVQERNKLFEEGKSYVGRKLWVKYFELTAEGVPRFPKTNRAGREAIRDEVL